MDYHDSFVCLRALRGRQWRERDMATGKDMTIGELEAAIRAAKKEVRRRAEAAQCPVGRIIIDVDFGESKWGVGINGICPSSNAYRRVEGSGHAQTPARALKLALNDLQTACDGKPIPKES